MNLYLVQHAKAASKETDPERSLTQDGFNDINKIAAFIEPLELTIENLWHSGKKRTQQTTEILAGAINVKNEISIQDGLAPNDDVNAIREKIISAGQDLMIVGHLPSLSKIASLLLTGSESTEIVAFKQGCIVCMKFEDANQWQIEWMITPDIIL